MRILVVEDDKDVGAFVVRGLKEAGHVVELADNGRDGLFMAASEAFDAVILDRMLPGGIDGLKILETLRGQKNTVPVLILSKATPDRECQPPVRGLTATLGLKGITANATSYRSRSRPQSLHDQRQPRSPKPIDPAQPPALPGRTFGYARVSTVAQADQSLKRGAWGKYRGVETVRDTEWDPIRDTDREA